MSDEPGRQRLSFEEFKLYYESAEKVTDRRLATNRWNYSICTAILVAIATITKWSLSNSGFLWLGFAAVAVFCLMAIFFCGLWIGQIRDFKKLNNAKFEILNAMAPHVEFDTQHPGALSSYRPFEKEWGRLKELNALEEIGNSQIVALKSSNLEYFIPKAFAVLFGGVLAVLVLVVALSWPPKTLVHNPATPAGTMTTPGPRP